MSTLCASDATLAIVHRFVERERPAISSSTSSSV